jgi:signal transduction histidine kinase
MTILETKMKITKGLLKIFGVAAIYYGTARLGLLLAIQPGFATAVWPPSGIALAAILLFGNSIWPGIWLGSFLVNFGTAFHRTGSFFPTSLAVAAMIGTGASLQALTSGFLLHRFIGARRIFDRTQDVLKFVLLAGFLGCMVNATLSVTGLCLDSIAPWSAYKNNWLTWWSGDVMGVLLITPLVLTWAQNPKPRLNFKNILEGFIISIFLFIVGQMIFGEWIHFGSRHYSLPYFSIPPLILATFRFNQRGATTATFLMSVLAIMGTVKGLGPYGNESLNNALLLVQTYIGVIILTTLLLASALTERERAENKLKETLTDLERSNRDLKQFAYVASHDLQEPLRIVANFAELLTLRYREKLDTQADEWIKKITNGVTRMQQLIVDLLTYSSVDAKKKTFEVVFFERVLDQVLNNLNLVIKETGAKVTHDPLPALLADESRMIQLFQNLLTNAIKFHGKETPQIKIFAMKRNHEWLFWVRDNGIGIDPQYCDRIFTLFERLHSKSEYPGTGIGLAICKKIVEYHGGQIWVESEIGKGSTFYFTLPSMRETI